MDDYRVALEMLEKYRYLDTISMLYLDEFESKTKWRKPPNYNTLRSRFRKALNECYYRGKCDKQYLGTSLYQTGDAFGGRCYISYEFKKYF